MATAHGRTRERENEREHARRYLDLDGREVHWQFIRAVLASVADTAIVPVQDLLGLGSDARMNRPGTDTGNWRWRLVPGQLDSRDRAKARRDDRDLRQGLTAAMPSGGFESIVWPEADYWRSRVSLRSVYQTVIVGSLSKSLATGLLLVACGGNRRDARYGTPLGYRRTPGPTRSTRITSSSPAEARWETRTLRACAPVISSVCASEVIGVA